MGTTAEKLSYLNETKQAIKTAIQGKGVAVADSDTFRSYAQKIANIDTKPALSGDAAADNVLSGKTFYSNSYTKQIGTMKNRSGTTTMESTDVVLAPGYYDSTSKVTIDKNSKFNLTSDNVRTGVTILGCTGTLEPKPTLEGNAAANDVLSGKTFYSNGYAKQTGTMTALSNLTYGSIKTDCPSFTIPKGYHDGTTKVSLDGDYVCLPYVEWLKENLSDYTLSQLGWNGLRYVLPFLSRSEAYAAWKGQTLPITVSGQSCAARLVSSNYNGKDGLVFYVTGISTQYALFSSGSTTSGGWGSSTSFRNTLNGTIYNSLSAAVKVLLKTNDVPYGIGGAGKVTTINTSQDKLFVPSLKELKGNSNYLYNGSWNTDWQPEEGTQFEWFAEDVNRIKPSSRTMTRSVPQPNRYCFVEANSTDANVIWLTTAETVAFCFVI